MGNMSRIKEIICKAIDIIKVRDEKARTQVKV